jgi:hypothetical protein
MPVPAQENEACEAVGTRETRRIRDGRRTGGLVACRWQRPPIDTRPARSPHAVTPVALRSDATGSTRVA